MCVKNLIQLVDVPDFRFDKNRTLVNYSEVAEDCDTKTISVLDAIKELSLSISVLSEDNEVDQEKIRNLSGVIMELSEIAIATNKISQVSSYLSGVQEASRKERQ